MCLGLWINKHMTLAIVVDRERWRLITISVHFNLLPRASRKCHRSGSLAVEPTMMIPVGGALLRCVLRETCRKWWGRRGKKLQSKHVILAGFWPQLYPTEDSGAWTARQSKSKSSLEARGPSRCSPLLFINFIRGCVASQVRAQPSLPATGREH